VFSWVFVVLYLGFMVFWVGFEVWVGGFVFLNFLILEFFIVLIFGFVGWGVWVLWFSR
jgi:hypothetical protein